jgi:cation diffusion facilitator family transporter
MASATNAESQTTELAARGQRKQTAALSSMVAAVVLAATKLVVGLLTGSLGLLSEALHSGLDLVGTILSFLAVRVSDRPPDVNHPYGHAKAESLVALFAVFLLTVTSLGILYEAYRKVFGEPEVPETNVFSFAVLILALAIDLSRSRYLARIARETHSQALAADAAHFASDLWSSGTVLASLTLIGLGGVLGWSAHWRSVIDAGAGVVVAGVIFHAAWGLAGRAVNSLMDEVPRHLVPAMEQAAADTPGVVETDNARLRYVGDQAYADVVVNVARGLSLEESEAISEDVIARVRHVVPGADVVVHTHPVASTSELATDLARVIAARLAVGVHHVRAFQTPRGFRLDMHMEVPSNQTLAEAHGLADEVEARLRAEMPSLSAVEIHIEPRHDETHLVEPLDDSALRDRVVAAAERVAGAGTVNRVEMGQTRMGYVVIIHCTLPGHLPIVEAHARTAEIERAVREALGTSYRVTVHPEPG